MTMRTRWCVVGALALAALGSSGAAQPCEPGWGDEFLNPSDPGEVYAAVEFDDGRGPALFIAGNLQVGPVGRLVDGRVEALPGDQPLVFDVVDLAVHDDGSGLALYAAGSIVLSPGDPTRGVVRWRNGVWEGVGDGADSVYALEAFDEDGEGPQPAMLFAGGRAPLAEFGGIRRWDGLSWTIVGGGLEPQHVALTLEVIDDGAGAALYMGGWFRTVGGLTVNNVARWDGTQWSTLGEGLVFPQGQISTIVWHDDGGGGLVYVGGFFEVSVAEGTAHGLVRWDGTNWSGLGMQQGSQIRSAVSFGTAHGRELLIAGSFDLDASPDSNIIGRWNGSEFQPIEGEPQLPSDPGQRRVYGTNPVDDKALVFGRFETIYGDVSAVDLVTWDGEELAPYVPHRGLGGFDSARALAAGDESGDLYVGGGFLRAGGVSRPYVAMRSASGEWHSMGDGLDDAVNALALHDAGQGDRLFAGGAFTSSGEVDLTRSVAMFDGESWSRVGTMDTGEVLTLASIGGELFAGGTFGMMDGGAAPRIARWDGASWHALGAGLSGGTRQVRAMLGWSNGIVVGGSFTNSGGAAMRNVAFWDGATWSPMGDGFNGAVRALAVHRDALYAAGEFTMSGLEPARYISRWDGSAWRALPGFLSAPARALSSFDDGTGSALYVGGAFGRLDLTDVGFIARWDGAAWSSLDEGLDGPVEVLTVHALDGGPRALIAGGEFNVSFLVNSPFLAAWHGCLSACPGDANGDQVIDMADLMIVVDAFNTAEGDELFKESADFDQNGVVDFEDLNRVVAGFNMGC